MSLLAALCARNGVQMDLEQDYIYPLYRTRANECFTRTQTFPPVVIFGENTKASTR
jgi:hypothetical protein